MPVTAIQDCITLSASCFASGTHTVCHVQEALHILVNMDRISRSLIWIVQWWALDSAQ